MRILWFTLSSMNPGICTSASREGCPKAAPMGLAGQRDHLPSYDGLVFQEGGTETYGFAWLGLWSKSFVPLEKLAQSLKALEAFA